MNSHNENSLVARLNTRRISHGLGMSIVVLMFMSTVCSAQKAELLAQSGHGDVVNSVVFSPDGRLLATGSNDTTVKLWEVATGRELLTLSHAKSVKSIAFSPDSRMLAS